jgi:hypothetical protein
MEADTVSETMDHNSTLTRLVAREEAINNNDTVVVLIYAHTFVM